MPLSIKGLKKRISLTSTTDVYHISLSDGSHMSDHICSHRLFPLLVLVCFFNYYFCYVVPFQYRLWIWQFVDNFLMWEILCCKMQISKFYHCITWWSDYCYSPHCGPYTLRLQRTQFIHYLISLNVAVGRPHIWIFL